MDPEEKYDDYDWYPDNQWKINYEPQGIYTPYIHLQM